MIGINWWRESNNHFAVNVSSAYLKSYKDVDVGNEVIVYGYPSSIGLSDTPQIDYTKPLVRRGNIAWKNERRRVIIITAPSYPGNSGGPVAEIEYVTVGSVRFDIIGVISEYVPYAHGALTRNSQTKTFDPSQDVAVLENSGYTVVTPSDAINEVLEQY